MKKNKVLAIVCFIAMFANLSISTFAVNYSSPYRVEFEPGVYIDLNDTTVTYSNAEEWAYKDYASSTSFEKGRILRARSIMMQHTDWAADGFDAYFTSADGETYKLPSFSQVFPEWDFEQISAYNIALKSLLTQMQSVSRSGYWTGWLNVPAAVDGVKAPVQIEVLEMENGIHDYRIAVMSAVDTEHCNIAFALDGLDVIYKMNTYVGEYLEYTTPHWFVWTGQTLGIRFSTYSVPGPMEFDFTIS